MSPSRSKRAGKWLGGSFLVVMGRRPLPTNVHLLRGNPSKLPLAELEGGVRVAAELPPPPKKLSRAARAHWRRFGQVLLSSGLVTRLDEFAFAMLCEAAARVESLEAEITRRAATLRAVPRAPVGQDQASPEVEALLDRTPNGFQTLAAVYIALGREREALQRCLAEFGLTPAQRTRVSAAPQLHLPLGAGGDEAPSCPGWAGVAPPA